MTDTGASTVVLFDGVCGLCNRLVTFLLRRDSARRLRFAALQSATARELLAAHSVDAADLDTVYVIDTYKTPGARLLSRGRAALFVFSRLSGPWRLLRVLALLPSPILDWGYRLVARHRYRIFGKYDTCPLPDPAARTRFIDLE